MLIRLWDESRFVRKGVQQEIMKPNRFLEFKGQWDDATLLYSITLDRIQSRDGLKFLTSVGSPFLSY